MLNLFKVNGEVWDVPVLLVDDIVDSGWTLNSGRLPSKGKGVQQGLPLQPGEGYSERR